MAVQEGGDELAVGLAVLKSGNGMSVFDPLRTFGIARYAPSMRPLWPIEYAVLEATAHDYPTSAESILQQAALAQVTEFENTGAGFFSTIDLEPDVPPVAVRSPLDGAYGNVEGIEDGMGFVVFLENGRVSLIEGYCHGDVSTVGIDFAEVKFDLKPWSMALSDR